MERRGYSVEDIYKCRGVVFLLQIKWRDVGFLKVASYRNDSVVMSSG